jgi:hypothetical protein
LSWKPDFDFPAKVVFARGILDADDVNKDGRLEATGGHFTIF